MAFCTSQAKPLAVQVDGDLHNSLSLPLLDSQAQASVVQSYVPDLQECWVAGESCLESFGEIHVPSRHMCDFSAVTLP